jgi:hypothetical protein
MSSIHCNQSSHGYSHLHDHQMTTNLGYLLGGITGEGRPLTRWFRLNRRGRANMYGGYQHQRSEGDVCCR